MLFNLPERVLLLEDWLSPRWFHSQVVVGTVVKIVKGWITVIRARPFVAVERAKLLKIYR